jgi:hypothetical protein
MKKLSLMTVCVVFLMSATLLAETTIFYPVEDAYIDNVATGDTFNSDVLQIQGVGIDSLPDPHPDITSIQRSFFQFDVSELAERTILYVEFGVYLLESSSPHNTPNMSLTYLEDDSWTQGTSSPVNQDGISWDDLPLSGTPVLIGENPEQLDTIKYYPWVVFVEGSGSFTHWYNDELDNGLASYMVTIGNENDTSYAYFASGEAVDDTTWPYLKIVHVPEPATVALLGLGGLLLRKRRV